MHRRVLAREGIVAEGHMGEDGIFVASEILAKHDENYMPREVADALKKSGRWKESGGTAATGNAPPTGNTVAPVGTKTS